MKISQLFLIGILITGIHSKLEAQNEFTGRRGPLETTFSTAQLNAANPFQEIMSIAPDRGISAIFRYEYLKGKYEPVRLQSHKSVFYLREDGLADSAKYYRSLITCEFLDHTEHYTYNENDLLTQYVYQRLNWVGVSSSAECKFEFNGNEPMLLSDTSIVEYSPDGFPTVLDQYRSYRYRYDSSNRKVTRYLDITTPAYSDTFERMLVVLDENNRIHFIEKTDYQPMFFGPETDKDSTTVQLHFKYNQDGKLTEKLLQSWDTLKQVWHDSQKTEIIYDQKGWTEMIYQLDKFGEWFLTHKNEFITKRDFLLSLEEKLEVKIYPNPADDQLNIRAADIIKGTYSLFDLAGKSLDSGPIHLTSGKTFMLNVDYLTPGQYLLVIDAENQNKVIRFLKN